MALRINAGERARARITIENVGQQPGTFEVENDIFLNGVRQGSFWKDGINFPCAIRPPSENKVQSIRLDPGERGTLTFGIGEWACSNPNAFPSGALMDVVWSVRVRETGESFEFDDRNALQHQILTSAQGEVARVEYTLV